MLMSYALPTFLPGKLTLVRGCARDYAALEQFHYIAKRPATWAAVWVVRYQSARDVNFSSNHDLSRPVAVAVLSYPVPSCRARERALGIGSLSRKEKLVIVNQQVRTISRVVVHPQFRSLGLSSMLVRCLCDHCDTRYIEAIAMMARAHPFFERAGMRRIEPENRNDPVYFILDRATPVSLSKAA